VLTDGRLRPITLGNLTIDFQYAAPSRLYWAGRPAMRFVRALYWVRDLLSSDDGSIRTRLVRILKDPVHGPAIQSDLRNGFHALPDWMQALVRELLQQASTSIEQPEGPKTAASRAPKRRTYHEKREVSLAK
jgi:hypothetical protein